MVVLEPREVEEKWGQILGPYWDLEMGQEPSIAWGFDHIMDQELGRKGRLKGVVGLRRKLLLGVGMGKGKGIARVGSKMDLHEEHGARV